MLIPASEVWKHHEPKPTPAKIGRHSGLEEDQSKVEA